MQDIKGYDRSIQELLSGGSYGIDYYQREYKWGRKQLQELVDDLTGRFLNSYQPGDAPPKVASYGHYFLGSIVVSQNGDIIHNDSPTVAKIIKKAFRGEAIFNTLALPSGTRVLTLVPSHHDHDVGESLGIRLDINHLIYFDR